MPLISDIPEQTEDAEDILEDDRRFPPLRLPPPDLRLKLNPLNPLILDMPLRMLLLLMADPSDIPDMLERTDASSSFAALVTPLMTDPVSGLDLILRLPGRFFPAPIPLLDDNLDVARFLLLLILREPSLISPNIRLACARVKHDDSFKQYPL
jgi:hypothetical protein